MPDRERVVGERGGGEVWGKQSLATVKGQQTIPTNDANEPRVNQLSLFPRISFVFRVICPCCRAATDVRNVTGSTDSQTDGDRRTDRHRWTDSSTRALQTEPDGNQ